jgi:TPP-dependent indolepyruvate ferredoxin oxidoreductase alpha subunit
MKSLYARIAARAVADAGTGVITHAPGFGCAGIFDALREIGGVSRSILFHEETAYTIAHGAALVGRRAAALIKTHGVAKAANSVTDSLSAGTTAGLVIPVADDASGGHSDNILDSSTLAQRLGIPFERPPIRDIYRGTVQHRSGVNACASGFRLSPE